MTFATCDFIFVCIILLFIIVSTIRGFVSELFGKASWILGLVAGFIFYDDISKMFSNSISNGMVRGILGFVIVFLIVFIIFRLLEIIFSRLVENEILSSLNRALGFLLGVGEGVALVSIIIHLLKWQTIIKTAFLDGSFFVNLLG